MSWPPLWGYYYWAFIHASGASFRGKVLDETTMNAIKSFLKVLCELLPCPGCRLHCMQYTGSILPSFNQGEEYWLYGIEFHNAVNKRTNKLIVTVPDREIREPQHLPRAIDYIV